MAVSSEEILKIASDFILSSPPGQLEFVVSDIRTLVNDDKLLSQTAEDVFRKYNTDQLLVVEHGDHKAIISKFGELNRTEYLDPRNNFIIKFDHIHQKILSTRPITNELDPDLEPYRLELQQYANDYVKEYYAQGTSAVFSSRQNSNFQLTLCISSLKTNIVNFWTGRWRSVWKLTFNPDSGQINLSGHVRVTVHYFENGNVQLNTDHELHATLEHIEDTKKLAQEGVRQIMRMEQDYHQSLENSYATLGETTFKALRRILPLTREKIRWENIRSYKIGSEIESGAPTEPEFGSEDEADDRL
eukprot:TRINITY_DN16690_c0_g1_i1.p1 TRINITY_DN16690_c0_g1~~TRINITY_DN16690_c0_g1_i1.p1  ORF type:complete len:302 (-),score=56.33 TRINITY_DN16690_c0_g1_i1:39-944(-)